MPTRTAPLLVLAAVALLLAAPVVSAQELSVFGSYWETEDLASTGGGGVTVAFGDGLLGMELRGTYYPDLTEDFETLLDDPGLGGDLEIEALPVDLGLRLRFGNLYASGGVTWFLLDSNVLEVDDEVGLYVGGGVEIGRGNVAFFAEALVRQVEGTVNGELQDVGSPGDLEDVIVDDIQIDLGGPVVNAGVVFRL